MRRRMKRRYQKLGIWQKYLNFLYQFTSHWENWSNIWTCFCVTTWTLARPNVGSSNWVVLNEPLSTVLYRERPTRPKSFSFAPVIPPLRLCNTEILQRMSRYEHCAVGLCCSLPLLRWLTLAVILLFFVLIQLFLKINLCGLLSFSLSNGQPIFMSHKVITLILTSTCLLKMQLLKERTSIGSSSREAKPSNPGGEFLCYTHSVFQHLQIPD